jgi:flagellar protein FlaG
MTIDATTIVAALNAQPQASPGASPVVRGIDPVPQAPAVRQSSQVNEEELRKVIEAADRAAKSLQSSVQFSVDSQSGRAIIRVVDTGTGQLIRQIPSEEVIAIRRALDRIAGLLIQREA